MMEEFLSFCDRHWVSNILWKLFSLVDTCISDLDMGTHVYYIWLYLVCVRISFSVNTIILLIWLLSESSLRLLCACI